MYTRVATVLWLGVATLLGWSLFDHLPYADLDRSWALGLHLAHLDGHAFGDDIVFNYGPLGFIARPMAGTGAVYAIGVVATLALTALAAWFVFSSLQMLGVALHAGGAATSIVMLVAPAENLLVELVLVLGAVWLIVHLRRRGPPAPAVFAALGIGIAALALIKVSIGPPGVFIVALTAAIAGRRHALAALAGLVGGAVSLWLLSGQQRGDVATWVGGVVDVASGHVSAMNTDDPSRRWEYVAVAAIVLAAGALVVDSRARARLRDRDLAALATVVAAIVIGWFVVRQGFTRHGARTRLVFFAAAWMVALWAPWHRLTRLRRAGLALVVASSAIAFVVAAGSLSRLVNPVTPIDDAFESARLVVASGYRDSQVEQARNDARDDYAVPGSMVATIGSEPVLIDPIAIGAAWASDLTWAPMPTMQRYIAYTEELDRRNAELLVGAEAPSFVLRQRFAVIDGRYAPAESPRYVRELLCGYDVVETSERWDLLARRADRCAEPVEVATIEAAAGDVVEVPVPADGRVLLVSIDFDRSVSDRLASAVLKPLSNPHIALDEQRFRMLPATSGTPALLSVPPSFGWGPETGLVSGPLTLTSDTAARVTFFEMAIEG